MELILLERIEKLGQMGDVVNVKPGYARNFLLPRKKALRATKENLAHFEVERKQLQASNLERRSEAEKIAGEVDGRSAIIIRNAGETGQLYGSVNARNIAEAITGEGVGISRNQVVMGRPIKSVGLHEMRIVLHPEVSVTVTVNVARSEEEAGRQAKTGRAVTAASEDEAEAEAEAAEAAAMAAEAFLEQPPEPEAEPEAEAQPEAELAPSEEPESAPESEQTTDETGSEEGGEAEEKKS